MSDPESVKRSKPDIDQLRGHTAVLQERPRHRYFEW